jgi:hypothetical protein
LFHLRSQLVREHRHQEFLVFLRAIDKAEPAELDIRCIARKIRPSVRAN